MSQPPVTLYTAGHGSRSADELVALLRQVGIETLVDVRANPSSRRHPQFESEALRASLEAAAIVYHWAGRQLGGLRPVDPASRHLALPTALRGYADHLETPEFRRAADRLVHLAGKSCTVILCAERLPEHCHRSLVADYLTVQGARVVHLIDPGVQTAHRVNARLHVEAGTLIYDRGSQQGLRLDA
jgi:uncharacterized protein (DUF488 family)